MSFVVDNEQQWRRRWEEERLYYVSNRVPGKENFYHLVMFPYPSGDLHIGHWFNFAPADVLARFLRMRGYNVLSPIGFDAFGLPAENAALQRGIHPRDWTAQNIEHMRHQLRSMGAVYDWSREVVTADPSFYRWTQWVFLKLFEAGLVERRRAPANWCPSCKTVLANEQVVEGHCERCNTAVEQRNIEQWVLTITRYAQRLLDGLQDLDWPERTKTMQRNWIGKSEGVLVEFPVVGSHHTIAVFTTRPDTLWGATYVVVAPEYLERRGEELSVPRHGDVATYLRRSRQKSERQRAADVREKTGADTGLRVTNPVNGEEIPVWVADYVLAGYGTGAVMAVPAHDQRDYEFAQMFSLPMRVVVESSAAVEGRAYEGDGMLEDSGSFTGETSQHARPRIIEWLESEGMGSRSVQWHLRDWIVSRQRYWGCPIPMVHCAACGAVPVPEEDLPVLLPELTDFHPREDGRSPLARAETWVKTTCPSCRGPAERETDTMDTFVDSSWYFIRYTDPRNDHAWAEREAMDAWLPVDLYIGGAEHTVLHLLYARFITKALHDQKLLSFDEPFRSLRHQGIMLGEDGQKMSKSRGNVVDPDVLVEKFGADVVRTYLCFMGPYDQGGPWDSKGIRGITRFFDRCEALVRSAAGRAPDDAVERALHRVIQKVSQDVADLHFNTAVAAMMGFINGAEHGGGLTRGQAEILTRLLAPFAPHRAEGWWRDVLGKKDSVHREQWPSFDPAFLAASVVEMPVQIDGKTRATIALSPNVSREDMQSVALADERVQRHLGGNTVKAVIVVAGKIVNIVTAKKE